MPRPPLPQTRQRVRLPAGEHPDVVPDAPSSRNLPRRRGEVPKVSFAQAPSSVFHRHSRRHRRRRRLRLWQVRHRGLTAFLAVVLMFAAGFFWKTLALRSARVAHAPAVVSPEAQREALDAVDEAVRAKYEKRPVGVASALSRARRADPQVPGLDILTAEAALEAGQLDAMRTAAEAAGSHGDAAASELLLGLGKWFGRGADNRTLASAVEEATVHFTASVDADPFFAPTLFFWGDMLRHEGREAEGGRLLLGALHRFNPWSSSDVLIAKILLASAEATTSQPSTPEPPPDSPWARAVTTAAAAKTVGEKFPLDFLRPFAAQPVLRILARDPFVNAPTPHASYEGKTPDENRPPTP